MANDEKIQRLIEALTIAIKGLNAARRYFYGNSSDSDYHKIKDWTFTRLCKFIEAFNPKFPLDTITFEDALACVIEKKHLPGKFEHDFLQKVFNEANNQHNGKLHWKFKYPSLILQFNPKHAGGFIEITFSSETPNASALTFPIVVEVDVYADMDERKNHSDECSIYYVEEHDPKCPVQLLINQLNQRPVSNEEWEEAERECYCGADDCCCEAQIVRSEKRTFDKNEEFEQQLLYFISNTLWS